MSINNPDVSLKYFPGIVINYTEDGVPLFGDMLRVEVNKQIFVVRYGCRDMESRDRLELLGDALSEIGAGISKQAKFGKKEKVIMNGMEINFF